MRTSPRSRPVRLAATVAATVLALAGCSSDDPDPAVTGAEPIEDVPTDDDGTGGTGANPLPDVPGVTGAEPTDDVPGTTDAEPSDDVDTEQAAQVPPLLDVVDGWPETTVTLAGDRETTVLAKVADEVERRRQGLMNVEDLPDGVGMLFLFDEAHRGGFWMKNTLVPLDIAYIRAGEVVAVMQMDPCEADPCPTYDPQVEYDAALEVNQGALAELGVGEGTPVSWDPPTEVAST